MADAVVVFAGPSLPACVRSPPGGEQTDHGAIRWQGPAVVGDALALLDRPLPRAVVLIDGLFDQVPAIRHKELLMLMARGVRVFGAASMGALRAAELAPHGMIGVGAIFNAFQQGRLRGDDEVALLHGPMELDWLPLSLPLVNARATLLTAARRRIVPPAVARSLLRAALDIFYQDRNWETVLARARAANPQDEDALMSFSAWLATGEVDLKRLDALACVRAALADRCPATFMPQPPMTVFTEALAASRRLAAADQASA